MKPKDYRSELEPVWCTACGAFGVLKAITQALTDLEVPPEKLAMVSGIGCTSRLPGYTNAYSFNSLHGRSLPIATGLKVARPDMRTLVVGGDGDGFSIGLGHIFHAAKRNVDLTYIVLDNGVYGLTKGQASPTTETKFKQRRGLAGPDEAPLNPVMLLLASGCGFVARGHAGNLPHLRTVIREAIQYPAFSFVHVLAGCVTYQKPEYADEIYHRCDVLPENFPNDDFIAASEAARGERFSLGVIYKKSPGEPLPDGSVTDDDDMGIWRGIQVS